MKSRLDGVKLSYGEAAPNPQDLGARGKVSYRVTFGHESPRPCNLGSRDARASGRRPTRLRSAKILDASNGFVCEAIMQNRSKSGLCLRLCRDAGLPARFAIHDDLTGEIVVAALVWRRGPSIGVRIVAPAPSRPIKPSDRFALRGRFYAIRD